MSQASYRAAGILPYHIGATGEVRVLLGKERESQRWCDFGGRRDDVDAHRAETAAREAWEESRGVLGTTPSLLKRLAGANTLVNDVRGYVLHLLELDERALHRSGACDCLRCGFHRSSLSQGDFGDKVDIQWFDACELHRALSSERSLKDTGALVLRQAFVQTCTRDLYQPQSTLRPMLAPASSRSRKALRARRYGTR